MLLNEKIEYWDQAQKEGNCDSQARIFRVFIRKILSFRAIMWRLELEICEDPSLSFFPKWKSYAALLGFSEKNLKERLKNETSSSENWIKA